jgi:anti-sigma regulatory factor (Ser/Thr protein kinase)
VAGRARLGEARGERTGQAATNAILYGSGDAQPVQVTIGVQGGWIQATIRDQGRPPSRTAPLMSLRGRGRWLIGQLVDELRLAKARPGMLVPLRQCISLGDSAGSASCAMVG